MVKIVNGQIVPDDAPSNRNNASSRQQSASAFGRGNSQLFPSTGGRLGSLSQNIQVGGYEMEMIWPLVIVGAGIMFGIKWSLILAGLLWLYNKNSQDASLNNQSAPPPQQSSSGASRDNNSQNSSNKSQTGFKGIRDVRGDGMN